VISSLYHLVLILFRLSNKTLNYDNSKTEDSNRPV